jgi:hypothetical protein
VTGLLFFITFVTSIPALFFYGPVLDDADFITGAGADNQIFLGATLELGLIIANIGIALVLFPILRRQNEILALGYVTARVIECVFIAVGIVSVLAVVTMRESSGDAATLTTVGEALVAVKDWTFLFGPGFTAGLGNGLILGYLMYRSGLMPRRLAALGLVGGALVCISGVLVLFGALEMAAEGQFLFSIPEIVWELTLAIYLLWIGFGQSPILVETSRDTQVEAVTVH